jgi:putative transposase
MLRTIEFRLYPTGLQRARLEYYLDVGRSLFNDALEQRKASYEADKSSLSFYTQCAELAIFRSMSSVLTGVPSSVERDALRRLDFAFKNFFRRVQEGAAKAGFPRFKTWRRWNSFSIPEPGRCVRGGRVYVSGMKGTIRARNIQYVEGKAKYLRVVRRAGKWFAQLAIDDGKPLPPPVPIFSCVGIDVGLNVFATMSNGDVVENPRFARKAERKIAHAQRTVARRVSGSRGRSKAVVCLQRLHERVANLRSNFTHHASKEIVSKHQFIAVEDLNIANMARGWLSKSIVDAAWGQFMQRLAYKAEEAGCTFVRVNPNGTSQECSQCGTVVQKNIGVRVHSCPLCGLTIDRDLNAARNVLQRALKEATSGAGRAIGNACGGEGCLVSEAGSLVSDATKTTKK